MLRSRRIRDTADSDGATQAHPTLREAEHLIKTYSSRDRSQIFRISRLLSDYDVMVPAFTPSPRYKYSALWKQWIETKGPDVAIVFQQ